MAVIKKKGSKGIPPISTASLPDVIFMILFFFMVSTTMREQELHLDYKLPKASEVQKLEKKSLVSYIHIGTPNKQWLVQYGPATRIQLNDAFATAKDIGQFVAAERDKLSEHERAQMTIALKADANTAMGGITDIKQELRRANALKLSYSAEKAFERQR
jgi:biopolymer transport protein ExbD